MKNIVLLTTASILLGACTTTKVDDHSTKYVTNYNTSVDKNRDRNRDIDIDRTANFVDPNDVSLEELSINNTVQQKSSVIEYVEPTSSWNPVENSRAPLIRNRTVTPLYGVTPSPVYRGVPATPLYGAVGNKFRPASPHIHIY